MAKHSSHPLESAIRLQRLLARAGHGSRRECEELIREGRVEVDGETVQQMGVRVDPDKQKVLVDGCRIRLPKFQYYAVNKPPGVVSTCRDPSGRTRVIDLINTDERVYNVGRLDKSSEGLILVTNDGELANRLTHPRYGVEKTYLVTVAGRPSIADLQSLKRGVHLAEGFARVSDVRIKKRRRHCTDLKIILGEGRNREIRRLLAQIGHKVTRLKRLAIGPLHLNELPVGAHRRLEQSEIKSLWRACSGKPAGQTPGNYGRRGDTRSRSVQSEKSGVKGRPSATRGRFQKKRGKPSRLVRGRK